MEELVAEIGAAFLCADLALVPQIRDDHAWGAVRRHTPMAGGERGLVQGEQSLAADAQVGRWLHEELGRKRPTAVATLTLFFGAKLLKPCISRIQ